MNASIKHIQNINDHRKSVLRFWREIGIYEFTNLEAEIMRTDWMLKHIKKYD